MVRVLAAALVVDLIALGRIVGLLADGVTESVTTALVVELVMVGLLVVGNRRLAQVRA